MPTDKASNETQGLPPPPAPTARDANPWPVESEPGVGPTDRPFGRRATRARTPNPVKRSSAAPRLAVAIAVALLVLGVVFLRLRAGGDIQDLAGVLFGLVVLVLFAVGRTSSGRRSRRGGDQGDST